MPRLGSTSPVPQYAKPVVQQCGKLRNAEGINSSGSKFDRKRYSAELAANIRDNRSVCVVQLERVENRSGALDEELDTRKLQSP
jgi:hypothetical protein